MTLEDQEPKPRNKNMLSNDKSVPYTHQKNMSPYYQSNFPNRSSSLHQNMISTMNMNMSTNRNPSRSPSPRPEILNIVDRFRDDPKILETILSAKSEENRTLAQREIRRTEEVRLEQRRIELEILKQFEYVQNLPGAKEVFGRTDFFREAQHANMRKEMKYDGYRESSSRMGNKYMGEIIPQNAPFEGYSMERSVPNNGPSQTSSDYRQSARSPPNSNSIGTGDDLVSPVYPRFEMGESPIYPKGRFSYFVERKPSKGAGYPYHDYPNPTHFQQPGPQARHQLDQTSEHPARNEKPFYPSNFPVHDRKSMYFHNQSAASKKIASSENRQSEVDHDFKENKRKLSLDVSYLPEDAENYVPFTYLKQRRSLKPKINSASNVHRMSMAAKGLVVNTGQGMLQKARAGDGKINEVDPMSAPVDFRPLKKKIILREDVIQAIRKKVQNSEAQKKVLSASSGSSDEKIKEITKRTTRKGPANPKRAPKIKGKGVTVTATSNPATSLVPPSALASGLTSDLSGTTSNEKPKPENNLTLAPIASNHAEPDDKRSTTSSVNSSDSVHVEDESVSTQESSSPTSEVSPTQPTSKGKTASTSHLSTPVSMARSSYQKNE